MGESGKTGRLEIAVFARAPVPGRVKRRLAGEIGDAAALAVYGEMLSKCFAAVGGACARGPDLAPVLWHHGAWPESFPVPPAFAADMRRQPSDDMLDNLREALRPGAAPGRRGAIVVGADHPDLAADHVLAIAALLDGHDVAVGPAEDGGFWALGTRVDPDGVLKGLPLGTADAFEALGRAVRGAGLSFGIGPRLADVDTAEDLRRRGRMLRDQR